jgi:peptidoglycan L-alanyl-D-glutamate endopeptidase CwlK
MDKITQQRIETLHPIIRDEVKHLILDTDVALSGRAKIRIIQGLRTFKEQDALYAQGRTKPGPIVTNAQGGQSIHNYGLAFDYCLILDGKLVSWDIAADYDKDLKSDWLEVVNIFTRNNWEWGGYWTFKDYPHLQKKGYSWRTLNTKYNNKETFTDNGKTYVKL